MDMSKSTYNQSRNATEEQKVQLQEMSEIQDGFKDFSIGIRRY